MIGGILEKNCPNKGGGLKNPSGKCIILFENCGIPTKNMIKDVNTIRNNPS